MDTSWQYIKMSEKAEEIQTLRPTEPDWITNVSYGWHIAELTGSKKHIFATSHPQDVADGSIWLPRQDQLQEMVYYHLDCPTPRLMIELILEYANSLGVKSIELGSMEQLWLAFVMKEKYGKVWHDEKWEPTEIAQHCWAVTATPTS